MQSTRRRFLQIGSLATVGSIAGCLGGGSDTLPAPTKGDPDAPVTVESFEDFTCKYCRLFALDILPKIDSQYIDPGSVKFVRHDYPFLDPEWSFKVANAARAVQDSQGDRAFFEFEQGLYEAFGSYSLETFETLAESVGADPETVRTAAVEDTYRQTLESELELGEEMGVSATPTVFVNGVKAPSPRFRDVASTIEDQL
ncbi:MAG: thioredoxin domain-containing protein [Halodesulfurarchaeum sp.]|nr:thioredoxin domain-containing protein [Halodesulfurarchaeum sp.]